MFCVENLSKSFNGNAALSDVSFNLSRGEIVGLIGPSGGGKTVLLKVIGKVMEPDTGQVQFDENLNSSGFSFQGGGLFDSLSVLENVAFPLLQAEGQGLEISLDEIYERSVSILEAVGLSAAVQKYPGQLSGGMRRRVGIARALVRRPDIVLLDEPTEGLDPVAASVIMELIRELHADYKPTMLLASHDLRRLIPSVDRLIALFAGRVSCDEATKLIETTAPEEVLRFIQTRYDFHH